jgi:enterochelin esterase-like enzyme
VPNLTLEEGFVPSSSKPPGRRIWTLHPGSRTPTGAVVFLDAELYLENVKAESVLRTLQDSASIPPVTAVFVSNESAVARHTDFVCAAAYACFLSEDLVPWVLKNHPELDRDRVVIAALSLSGLAAAHAALTHSHHFRAAICQSPSFWWDDERFGASLPRATDASPAYWISVGNQETVHDVSHPPSGLRQHSSQLDACQRTCDALRAAGYNVNFRVFHGGHDPECWRDDLFLALPWIAAQGR